MSWGPEYPVLLTPWAVADLTVTYSAKAVLET